jgi:hypothetical protein
MSSIIAGRQLRAARILAGLTQNNLRKRWAFMNAQLNIGNRKITKCRHRRLTRLTAVLRDHGVVVSASPARALGLRRRSVDICR